MTYSLKQLTEQKKKKKKKKKKKNERKKERKKERKNNDMTICAAHDRRMVEGSTPLPFFKIF
jgi:hypothetical protein